MTRFFTDFVVAFNKDVNQLKRRWLLGEMGVCEDSGKAYSVEDRRVPYVAGCGDAYRTE